MKKFRHLYLWMIIPFLIIQIGIFFYYWPKFTTQTWEIHIHYWLVSFWFLLVIVQPYLIVNGKVPYHRTLGMFGFLIAGGVLFTGISLLDIPLKILANYDPAMPGPPPAFYYGTMVIEFILAMAFAYSVLKGIIHRHNTNEHSWWLICSVFFLMAPALGRGMIVFWRAVLPPENFNPMIVFVSAEVIYLPLLLLFAVKFGKIRHQATIIGILLIFVRILRIPIGSSESVQEFLTHVVKW